MLLGYYISDNEDYIAQYHAFRMAIQTSRHKPYEIVCDNQGGHKKNAALGLFSKISRIHRPTAPYNGESKGALSGVTTASVNHMTTKLVFETAEGADIDYIVAEAEKIVHKYEPEVVMKRA